MNTYPSKTAATAAFKNLWNEVVNGDHWITIGSGATHFFSEQFTAHSWNVAEQLSSAFFADLEKTSDDGVFWLCNQCNMEKHYEGEL